MSGIFYTIFNPNNWIIYLVIIMVALWIFKKPRRQDNSLAQKIKELEENAKNADQVLFDRIEHLEEQLDRVDRQFNREASDYLQTIAGLQERIEILEAIVTDSRYDLDKKISAL